MSSLAVFLSPPARPGVGEGGSGGHGGLRQVSSSEEQRPRLQLGQ